MTAHYITRKKYREIGQVFHWAYREHYVRFFKGEDGRHSRSEKILPELVKKGNLIAVPHGKKLAYSVPRRCRGKKAKTFYRIEHGLACTECLVRVWLSDTKGEIKGEHKFRQYKIVPEWGIIYPSNRALLFEFSTEDNFSRIKLIEQKIERYVVNLKKIADDMNCRDAFVLFVAEASRDKLKEFVRAHNYLEDFFFTDYRTFLSVSTRKQLTTPIYIWGGDGKEYPLEND
jgi:hypothetical protein